MPDMPLRVGEIKRGPVVISEGTPYRVVVIDRDGVTNPHVLDGPADVISVVLERELGRVDADHHQPAAGVFPGPGADIGSWRIQLMQVYVQKPTRTTSRA